MMQDMYERARQVRLAVFDVDGVLTDGKLYYTETGEELKVFDVRDGQGIKMLADSGVRIAIITSRCSGAVTRRAENLGIELVFQGIQNKLETFGTMLTKLGMPATAVAYMGDDLVDAAVLKRCGFAISVPEAPAPVRELAHYVTRAGGGHGAAREACEFIMRAQGTLGAQLAAYLQ
jgi:3-deoxy-D-manno-octulosonate 8-phosphate phosphatase (KDO 8-P phosphatase)